MSTVLRKGRVDGGWSIEVEKDLMPEIQRNIAMLGANGGLRATCGIHHDAGLHPMYRGRPTPQNWVPTAHLAFLQEKGDDMGRAGSIAFGDGNTPSRPFLGNTAKARKVLNQERMKGIVIDALNRKFDVIKVLRIVQDQAAATRLYIQSEPFKPLAPLTKRHRLVRGGMLALQTKWFRLNIGLSDFTPIIESGKIQNSIEGRVDNDTRFS